MSKASAYFTIENALNGKHDIKEIKREFDSIRGVISVSANNDSGRIAVDFDTTGVEKEELAKRLQKLGYTIKDSKFENHIM
jgi:copper chaperone CopZ